MSFECDMEEKDDYLLVTLRGVLRSVDEAASIAEQVVPCAQQSGLSLVLQDERQLTVELDAHDTMTTADQVGEFHPWSGVRVASIRSEANWEIGLLTETSLQNRSVNYRVFRNFDDGVSWLLKRTQQ